MRTARRHVPSDPEAYRALVDRIVAARTASELQLLIPELAAFEGGKLRPELAEQWLRRWTLVSLLPPPAWPPGPEPWRG